MPIPFEVQAGNLALFQRVTCPLELILERMKHRGIPVSPEVLLFKAEAWKRRMSEHAGRVYEQIGKSFNFKSPKQVRDILYDPDRKGHGDGVRRLGLPPVTKWSKLKRQMVETTDQYAFGRLLHENPDLEVLRDWGMYNRLFHRYSAFVIKLLRFSPCRFCTEKTKTGCMKCAGTGVGEILGHDPRYVTVRNGEWRFHPSLLLLAVTGRPISTDPNILQWPRNDNDRKIDCRDIVVAPEGKKLVYYDLNKAELFVAGFLFDDPAMLDLVRTGNRAFSIIASEVFGIPEESCAKGTDKYHVTKTAVYAFIYFVQARTLHETLARQEIWIPVDECERMIRALEKRFERYRNNVMYHTWKWIKERDPFYIVDYQGRRFVSTISPEFEGYRDYNQFIFSRCRARTDFFEVCRKTASFIVQGSATGDNCQADGLYIINLINELTGKRCGWNQFENGDWNLAAPLYLKYDELCVEAHDDYVEPIRKIFETRPGKYEYMEGLLGRKRLEGLQLGTDITVEHQWSTGMPPANYREMTREKNPAHYYVGTTRFRI